MTVHYFRRRRRRLYHHHHHHHHPQHQQSRIFSLISFFFKNILKYLRNVTNEHIKQIKNIKFTIEEAMKAQKGSRVTVLLFQ